MVVILILWYNFFELSLYSFNSVPKYYVMIITSPTSTAPDFQQREERFGMTPLIVAIISEQVDLVHLLLEKGASPNCQEEVYGMTGLMFVVFQNDVGLAIALMLRGANPNIQNSKANTALLLAVEANNRNDIVRLLLDKGADPNIQGENGMTALMMAVAVNNRKVVEMIIEKRYNYLLTFQGTTRNPERKWFFLKFSVFK